MGYIIGTILGSIVMTLLLFNLFKLIFSFIKNKKVGLVLSLIMTLFILQTPAILLLFRQQGNHDAGMSIIIFGSIFPIYYCIRAFSKLPQKNIITEKVNNDDGTEHINCHACNSIINVSKENKIIGTCICKNCLTINNITI